MRHSGDGVLTAFHLGQRKLIEKSDNQESELLCVSIIKVNLYCKIMLAMIMLILKNRLLY